MSHPGLQRAGREKKVHLTKDENITNLPVDKDAAIATLKSTQPYQRGRTSITVMVEVFAERFSAQGQYVKVTEASLTYVAIDHEGRPRPIPDEARAGWTAPA